MSARPTVAPIGPPAAIRCCIWQVLSLVVYIQTKAPMPQAAPAPAILRFDVYTVDLRAGELYKSGRKIKLQEQPFQILAMLLEHPGNVVTREEMRQRLWSGDTFVDFEHSLNTAIKKIRHALNDEAGKPRFVETLRRRGYRFAGFVAGTSPLSESSALPSTSPSPSSSALPPASSELPGDIVGKILILQDEAGGELLSLSIDETTLKERQKLETASDDLGLALLFADQKVLMVRSGTRVKVLDLRPASGCYEVRVLEGEHSAKSALVPPHLIRE
jgi:DNA-binding winged helix-turn-helix (wHTH) protein